MFQSLPQTEGSYASSLFAAFAPLRVAHVRPALKAEAEGVVYLEGVYVAPGERGRGTGLRCLSHLTRELLQHADSVCLFVNERNEPAHAFYRRAGFRFNCHYDTIFLRRD